MKSSFTRRRFLGTSALAGAGLSLQLGQPLTTSAQSAESKPAILGGKKLHDRAFPTWPIFDERDDQALLQALHTGKWGRLIGQKVTEFEKVYAHLAKARHCIATASGTTALLSTLGALGLGPGDEVILPSYTFVATYNAITFHYALPVFVDTDPDTFQIDARKINAAITSDTKAILPVHLGGSAPDMDAILRVADPNKIPVIEDACQAHQGEWRGRPAGNAGLAGCFSFQASKNLTAGEGGAIITNDDEFAARCYNFHNHARGRTVSGQNFSGERGANFRMTEFQGALLLAQLSRWEAQARTREENAALLTQWLREIPGLKPAQLQDGCTRSSYHLYMFRYQQEHFSSLSRDKFLQAMAKEGFPCFRGYTSLSSDPYVQALAGNRHYQKIYGKETMAKWRERNHCPVNDKLCAEAVWFTQATLLGTRSEMEQIVAAIRRIQKQAGDIARL